MARNRKVDVMLEDHHTETWKSPPPPKLKAFSGVGNVLGNPTPAIITSSTSSSSLQQPSEGIPGPFVDETKPVTQLRVRLPDGSK